MRLVFLLLAVLLVACTGDTINVYATASSSTSSGAGGGGGEGGADPGPAASSSGSTVASTATAGGADVDPPECVVASDCPGVDTECRSRRCNGWGECVVELVDEGTVVGEAVVGDCAEVVCDGAGAVVSVLAPDDLLEDDNECTDDLCTDEGPSHPARPFASTCGNGLWRCDETSTCVVKIPIVCKVPGSLTYTCAGEGTAQISYHPPGSSSYFCYPNDQPCDYDECVCPQGSTCTYYPDNGAPKQGTCL